MSEVYIFCFKSTFPSLPPVQCPLQVTSPNLKFISCIPTAERSWDKCIHQILRISLWTNNIKHQGWGGESPAQGMGQHSFGNEQPAGKWLLILGDNSSQLPVRKCPAGRVPCINFTLTSPELYFIFNPYGNSKRRLKWRRTRESRIQTKLHRVLLSPQTDNLQCEQASLVPPLPSTSSCITRSSWILKQATSYCSSKTKDTMNVCNLHRQ